METNSITIKKRFKKGFFANSFGFFVNLFIQIITVPILILYWGVDLYGEWLIISAFPAYLNFSNLGLSDAMATKMTIYVTNKNRKKALLLFQSSWRVVTSLYFVASFILILSFVIVPVNNIFNINQINEDDLLIILILFAVYIFFGLQSSLLGGAYRCEGNYPEHALILNTSRLMESVIGLFFVSLGGGAVMLITTYVIIRFLGLVCLFLYLRKKSPWISILGGNFDFQVVKKIVTPSLASFGFSFGNMFINQGVLLIIGFLLGPASVAIFSVYRSLSRMTLKVVGIFNNIFLPEMTASYASNKKKILRVLNRRLLGTSFQLSVLCLSFLILFGEIIINYWTMNEIKYHNILFLLILLETLTYLLWYAGSVLIVAINRHTQIVLWYLILSIISLIIMVLALPSMGIIAVPLSLSLGNLLVGFYVIVQSNKITEDTISNYIKSFFKIKFFKFK